MTAPATTPTLDRLRALHGSRLLQQARRLSPTREDAEDLVQDVWLRVLPHVGRIRRPEAAWTFLSRTLRGLTLDRHRRQLRRVNAVSVESLQADDVRGIEERIASDDEASDQSLLRRERECALLRALDALSPDQRHAVIQHDLNGLPYEAISGPRNASTWRNRRRRGIARLRENVRNWFPELADLTGS
jgi:RNA polymerase sigma factor (sigma-70 family)